jgi:hypothetical protein
MSHINKSKFRRPGAQSKRRKMFEPHKSKMEQEHELSAGPREESTATSGSAFKEPPTLQVNASLSPGENHERGVRAMDDKENESSELFEGFSDMTKTLFSPERAKKVAALWIDNSEKAADQALKFQAKATEWSKNTMFAPVFEMQNSFARSCVEITAKTARRLWQLE